MMETARLPEEVEAVLAHFVTTEYAALDLHGRPTTWPLIPYYSSNDRRIEVGIGLGSSKKADDARRNPNVALLFSDHTGSGLARPPDVLVQGTATVDDGDPTANFERSIQAFTTKLPRRRVLLPPRRTRRLLGWYFARISLWVRIERVYAWPEGDTTRGPQRLDLHPMSPVQDTPVAVAMDPGGRGEPVWDIRLDRLGRTHDTAVVSVPGDDDYPFAIRAPIGVDREAGRIRIESDPPGVPLHGGPACLTVHDHDPHFTWFRNCQVRGDLARENGGWVFLPHRVIGGDHLLPRRRPAVKLVRAVRRTAAYRRTAKDTLRQMS